MFWIQKSKQNAITKNIYYRKAHRQSTNWNRRSQWNLKESYMFSVCERLPVFDQFPSGHKTCIGSSICRLHPLLELIFPQISLPHPLWKIFFFFSSPSRQFSAKAVFLFWKCLSTFDLLLLANFSPQIRHIHNPLSSEINANESAQTSLDILFSSDVV